MIKRQLIATMLLLQATLSMAQSFLFIGLDIDFDTKFGVW